MFPTRRIGACRDLLSQPFLSFKHHGASRHWLRDTASSDLFNRRSHRIVVRIGKDDYFKSVAVLAVIHATSSSDAHFKGGKTSVYQEFC